MQDWVHAFTLLGTSGASGGITKEGRGELRAIMVVAGCRAVERHPHWKAYFEQLSSRIGKQKAIVAIARKLLVAVWHVLTQEQADVHADVQAIARKLLKWIQRCGATPGKRRPTGKILRQYLDQLNFTEQVECVPFHGRAYHIALQEGEST
jgi:transposase